MVNELDQRDSEPRTYILVFGYKNFVVWNLIPSWWINHSFHTPWDTYIPIPDSYSHPPSKHLLKVFMLCIVAD